MNDEAALLRAICENPDEDTPRLMFADWLSEQGGAVNVAWANGIRAQVYRARGDTTAALAQQSRIFESWYGLEKLHERLGLPAGVAQEVARDWDRGFPSGIYAPFRPLRELWHQVAFRLPIRKLHVFEVSESGAAEFVTWPALSVLQHLTFVPVWEVPQPVDVLPVLAGCADLRHLESLKAQYALINDASASAILDSPYLAGLKTCELRYGYDPNVLSPEVRDRFRARFGQDSIIDEDAIPF